MPARSTAATHSRRRRTLVATAAAPLFALLLVLLAACGSGGSPAATGDDADGGAAPAANDNDGNSDDRGASLPEFPELTRVSGWLNGEPTTIRAELEAGRVVLIDFWTYTCINCIRTMPFLQQWQEKYANRGLTIIGVHTPEFDFEERAENVRAAIANLGVTWVVAQDNDYGTWNAFNNRFWPAKYLLTPDDGIVYMHFGEGDYRETEAVIREALSDAGWDVGDIPIGDTEEPQRDPDATSQTRELYGGYQRNYSERGLYAAQLDYYIAPDLTQHYEDIDSATEERMEQQWYLQGLWRNEREAIVHARQTEDLEDYIALRILTRSVNVVLNPTMGEPFDVFVELDGRPLRPEEYGADIETDEEGRAVLRVDGPRLYAIVELPAYGEHELKLRSNSDDFAISAFTFGVYTEGA